MAYFPFFVDIENQDCLIAGGGAVALRKVEVLLPYGPRITVVSPEIGPEMEALANGRETGGQEAEIILKRRPFSMEDLDGRDFVIAATDNEELNHRISEACKAQRTKVEAALAAGKSPDESAGNGKDKNPSARTETSGAGKSPAKSIFKKKEGGRK